MIDVHILITNRLPEEWIRQSISSVSKAISEADVKVDLHFCPEDREDFWGARWNGYAQGNNPWATYVDLDDWIEPHAFNAAVRYLRDDREMVALPGVDHSIAGKSTQNSAKTMKFVRRELINRADKNVRDKCCPACYMQILATTVAHAPVRVLHMRTGYRSLASKWKPTNGMA